MPDGVSVIICCYNSAQRLPETLRHLAAQQVAPGISWEIIVVDNASTDDTEKVARAIWPTSAAGVLRIAREPEAGLSHARIRGIGEARYDIISFVDDDNWVDPDWVERVYAIFSSHPEIGACGGRIEAVCEITPPTWFASIQAQYAVGQQHEQSGDITRTTGTLLCGAGLSLRTSAVRKLLAQNFVFMMSGRKGAHLLAGEDTELCFALRASGWRFWYDNDLVLRHFIPRARLEWPYALGLMRGMGASSTLFTLYLFALNGPPFETYPTWKKTWPFQLAKTFWKYLGVVVSHPRAWFGSVTGATSVLELEREKSRLASLWELRWRYGKLQEHIRKSDWARV